MTEYNFLTYSVAFYRKSGLRHYNISLPVLEATVPLITIPPVFRQSSFNNGVTFLKITMQNGET
jgi:hypothetical protein